MAMNAEPARFAMDEKSIAAARLLGNFVTMDALPKSKRGRPPLRKKGAMTPAEKQKRYRRRIRKSEAEAKLAEQRERSRARRIDPYSIARLDEREAETHRRIEAYRAEWARRYGQAPMPPMPGANALADELVRQMAEFIAECAGEITIDDVRAAIDRRFGTRF
jgi:DNA repair exonuclease SbcCD ATPase subunit